MNHFVVICSSWCSRGSWSVWRFLASFCCWREEGTGAGRGREGILTAHCSCSSSWSWSVILVPAFIFVICSSWCSRGSWWVCDCLSCLSCSWGRGNFDSASLLFATRIEIVISFRHEPLRLQLLVLLLWDCMSSFCSLRCCWGEEGEERGRTSTECYLVCWLLNIVFGATKYERWSGVSPRDHREWMIGFLSISFCLFLFPSFFSRACFHSVLSEWMRKTTMILLVVKEEKPYPKFP